MFSQKYPSKCFLRNIHQNQSNFIVLHSKSKDARVRAIKLNYDVVLTIFAEPSLWRAKIFEKNQDDPKNKNHKSTCTALKPISAIRKKRIPSITYLFLLNPISSTYYFFFLLKSISCSPDPTSNSKTIDLSFTSTKTKYIKLNTKTQIFFNNIQLLYTLLFSCWPCQRASLSNKVYKKVVKFSFKQQKIIWVLVFRINQLICNVYSFWKPY